VGAKPSMLWLEPPPPLRFEHNLAENSVMPKTNAKSLKLVIFVTPRCTKTNFFCGSARTPLGELTALPKPPVWWGGGLLLPSEEPHPLLAGLWLWPFGPCMSPYPPLMQTTLSTPLTLWVHSHRMRRDRQTDHGTPSIAAMWLNNNNKMQPETAHFASGTATWRT